MNDDFIDPRLRAQVLAIEPAASVALRPALPPSLVALAGAVQAVTTAEAANRMADALGRLDVAFVGMDAEFRFGDAGELEDDDNVMGGLSTLRPLLFGLAAMVVDPEGRGYVPVRYAVDVRRQETHAGLAAALALPLTFVAHHAKSELFALSALGLPWPRALFCTWLAAQLLDLGRHHARYIDPTPVDETAEEQAEREARQNRKAATSLQAQLNRYGIAYPFGGDKDAMRQRYLRLADDATFTSADFEYVTADAFGTAALYLPQTLALAEAGLTHHYNAVELPALRTFAEIEWHGLRVDRSKIKLAHEAARHAVDEYEERLRPYWFGDPAASGETASTERVVARSFNERDRVLGELGLLDLFASRDATSGYTFEKGRLKQHRGAHRVIELLYRHGKYSGILRDRLFAGEFIDTDDRIHPWINPLGADSGRPSFSKPNVVGIGKILRPIVVPDSDEFEIAELDYVAQEVFIAAAHFGDEVLLADCNKGDPYSAMIRQFCRADVGIDADDLDDAALKSRLGDRFKPLRSKMKILMLAVIYGMGGTAIAAQMRTTLEGARRLRAQFFERYPRLALGIELSHRRLHERGYVQTVTGLRRFRGREGALSSWEEKWAVNAPIQGGGACVLKRLLPRVQHYLAERGGRVLLPIFDALLVQYPRGTGAVVLPATEALMVDTMRELYPGTRPRVDVNAIATRCWNKNGYADSIERFVEDPEFEP